MFITNYLKRINKIIKFFALIICFQLFISDVVFSQFQKNYFPEYCYKPLDSALSSILMTRNDLTMRWDATGNDLHRLKNIKNLFSNPLSAFTLSDSVANSGKYGIKDPLPFFLLTASLLDNSDNFSPERPILTNDKIKSATGIDLNTLNFAEQFLLRKFLVLAIYVELQTDKNRFLLDEEKLKRVLNYCDSLLIHSENDNGDDLINDRLSERISLIKAKKFFGEDAQGLDYGLLNETGTLLYLSSFDVAKNMAVEITNLSSEIHSHVWDTKFGRVAIGGKGDDTYTGEYFCIIDVAGNDIYKMTDKTKNQSYNHPTNLIVDFNGDDNYIGGDYSFGGSVFGNSTLIDMKGNDNYSAKNFSLGCGFFSTNVLYDGEGNDHYSGGTCVEGTGLFGVGLLIDAKGNDSYNAHLQSQGFGFTRGFGAILECEGNDQYISNSPYTDFLRYDDHFETFCQGAALGYRPVASGGYGFICDYSGNDLYQADIYGQGVGYWYGLGGIIDQKGNDSYSAFQYAQGAGIHLAFGVLIDTSGNDNYFSHGVSQGCGHDIGFGGLYDAKGDDNYVVESLSLGGGNANAISFFLDAGGNDGYLARNDNTMGFSDFRRDYGMIGIFLDLEGKDFYGSVRGKNDSLWNGSYYGVGYDGENLRPSTAPPSVEKKIEKSNEEVLKELSSDIPTLFIQASAAPQKYQYLVEPARKKLVSLQNESLPYLLNSLNTEQPREALMISLVLPKMGVIALKALIDTVKRGEKSRIGRAVYILGEIKNDTAAEIIADRMVDSSSNWRLRATCGEALMKLNTSKVKDQLLETIKDTIPIVRAYALRAYLKSANRQELKSILYLIEDTNQIVRYQFLTAFQKRGVDDLSDFIIDNLTLNPTGIKSEIFYKLLFDLKSIPAKNNAIGAVKRMNNSVFRIKQLNDYWKKNSEKVNPIELEIKKKKSK